MAEFQVSYLLDILISKFTSTNPVSNATK